jgi:hypothetical protein
VRREHDGPAAREVLDPLRESACAARSARARARSSAVPRRDGVIGLAGGLLGLALAFASLALIRQQSRDLSGRRADGWQMLGATFLIAVTPPSSRASSRLARVPGLARPATQVRSERRHGNPTDRFDLLRQRTGPCWSRSRSPSASRSSPTRSSSSSSASPFRSGRAALAEEQNVGYVFRADAAGAPHAENLAEPARERDADRAVPVVVSVAWNSQMPMSRSGNSSSVRLTQQQPRRRRPPRSTSCSPDSSPRWA